MVIFKPNFPPPTTKAILMMNTYDTSASHKSSLAANNTLFPSLTTSPTDKFTNTDNKNIDTN